MMSAPRFEIRECTRPECAFRFPALESEPKAQQCPVCKAPTQQVEAPYENAKVSETNAPANSPWVEALLDNIRSTFNVGAMFRTADGAGLRRLHLCGITPTPDHPKLVKTALGAETQVPWESHPNGLQVAQALKARGYELWALEGGENAIPLTTAVRQLPSAPIVLIAGNEVAGVDPGILRICDRVVAIPMQGYKRSLNVAIAFGIAVYLLRFGRIN